MARKGHGRPANLVQISGSGTTYPDDGSSPVGSNEWNANRDTTGILGVTKKTEAIASANTINVTDSYIEITTADSASGGSSDGIRTLAAVTTALSTDYYPSDTSTKSYVEGDLIYVVKAAGQATTSLVHQGGGAGAGKITTLTGEDKELSATVPTILLARTIGANVEWVEYGGGAVADLSITTAKIAADAITGAKLADNAVDSEHYTDGSIDLVHLSADSVDSTQYVDGSIDTAHIGNNQVTGAKIAMGSDAAGDILYHNGTDYVRLAKGSANHVLQINSGATAPEWATVTATEIASGAVDTAELAADAVTAAKIADDVIDSEHLTAGGIDTEHLGNLQVTGAKIAADSIDGTKLADDAVDSEHYTDASIDVAHMSANSVDSDQYADGSIDTIHIANLQITTGLIAADAVTAAKVADDIINSEHLAAGGIDLEHMSSQSVDEDNLYISNAGNNGEFLSKQSGDNGGLTWAAVSGYSAPTIGSTSIASGSTNATIAGLTLTAPVFTGTAAGVDLTLSGNLTVSGTTTTLDVTNLSIEDPLIQLAKANATSDSLDIGFWGLYDTSTSQDLRAGLFRDATDGKWRLFKDTQEDLTTLTAINTGATGYAVATLVANVEGTLTGTASAVAANSIVQASLADDAVGAAELASDAVVTASIVDLNVTTAKIAADAITEAKIVDNAINSEHYTDGSIDLIHLSADSVNGDKIVDDAINSEHYAAGSIDSAHIANDQIDSQHYADGSIDNAHIADDQIDSEHYAAGSIDTAHIADDQITLAKMAGGTDGNLITYDTSGNPAAVATGNSGQVLTSAGADAVPTFQTASGAWVGTATSDLSMGGTANTAIGDIIDINRLSFNIKAHTFDADGTNNANISAETELYVRQLKLANGNVDNNNDGLFCRIKKNGSDVYLQIA